MTAYEKVTLAKERAMALAKGDAPKNSAERESLENLKTEQVWRLQHGEEQVNPASFLETELIFQYWRVNSGLAWQVK